MTLLSHIFRENVNFIIRITHLYHKKITRTATLEHTLENYENLTRASRSNTGTQGIGRDEENATRRQEIFNTGVSQETRRNSRDEQGEVHHETCVLGLLEIEHARQSIHRSRDLGLFG